MAQRYLRKVIHISAEHSPNVRFARWQEAQGLVPTNEIIVEGVLTWDEYQTRRKTWDPIRQAVGLDGIFYTGPELLLFPSTWLSHANALADKFRGKHRSAKGGGCDPAEGGDSTALAAVDELGLIELVSLKTPDTNLIPGMALAFMKKHNIPPERFCFDRGGGGKQHADRLRAQGHAVRTIAFGETITLQPKRGLRTMGERVEQKEDRYTYMNRRAEMYYEMSQLLDPSGTSSGWAISREYIELLRQLRPIPKTVNEEGRYYLLPKNKRDPKDTRKTLTELIGCSPDEADAVALACHAMLHKPAVRHAGAVG